MHVKRRDILVLAIGAAIAAFAPDVGTAQVGLRALRDEAVQHIGWVAGNAYGYPEWSTLRPYVGKGGQYYNFFFGLMPGGSNRRTEISHLASLYREWFTKGQTKPFNVKEANQRIGRVRQIVEDINTYLAKETQ